jgi:ribonuclease P protein component
MKNTVSIVKNKDFRRVYSRGKYYVDNLLVIYVIKNKLKYNRLGIVANKKVGKAVLRNKVRRLIRENYRLIEDRVEKGYDIVIVSRVKASKSNYYDIKKSIVKLFDKTKLLKDEKVGDKIEKNIN